ncbi:MULTISPECIES: J domain-containing protein [Cyanophyceae]|uniref:J domain-containing protein n=1 Tax=Cyanophyceae TaxID=3028117 RepID=UPI00168A131E|nr:J domain-containing protein [Trichocoleus sp. FACHB-40]MBD2006997.1 J domain-containing protein [Trichocoleus sp. FACHB-40]
MNRPVGGRTKKADYTTSVLRVPDPVRGEVIKVIEKFYKARQPNKPVTGLSPYWQIPASLIPELLNLSGDEPDFDWYCGIEQQYKKWWKTDGKLQWEKVWRKNLERFLSLADRVNKCLFQVDNTWAITFPKDVSEAIKRLHEYRLIHLDQPATAASPLETVQWVVKASDLEWGIVDALQEKRWGILKALEVGVYPPVNRREYWLKRYSEQLGKTKVNYWQWRQNPESRAIANELNQLLELPEPEEDARRVLEVLAEGKDPFYKPEGGIHISFEAFSKLGALGTCEPAIKQRCREAFRQWHQIVLAQLGKNSLEGIYRVCYSCDWNLIESILAPPLVGEWWEVLEVLPNATLEQVKTAYRTAAKLWHTDVNSSPIAKARMIALNKAREEAEASFTYRYKV